MEGDTTTADEQFQIFRQISLDYESSINFELYDYSQWRYRKQTPRPPPEPPNHSGGCDGKFVDFEKYVAENCENKIRILQRSTFHEIQKPIVIAFNYFREMCYYHTDKLDRLYQLALEFGERIEIIVADKIDFDIIDPYANPLDYFSLFVSPEDENIHVYVINSAKEIYEHFDAYNKLEVLRELCENLLDGSLYKSQPLSTVEDCGGTMVKICVHSKFNEMVRHSNKDVLLIVSLGDYRPDDEYNMQYEPDYEQIAREFQNANVEIIYMDGDRNFVDFKYKVFCYPTILFIPHNDKENFVHYNRGARDTENVRDFIKDNLGQAGVLYRELEFKKIRYQPLRLPEGKMLFFEDLKKYLQENYPDTMRFVEDNNSSKGNFNITYLLNFHKNGAAYYLEVLQKLYQISASCSGYVVQYFIGDLQQIDLLYPRWYRKYIDHQSMEHINEPLVFATNRLRFTSQVEDFKTISSLYFYAYRAMYDLKYYYSQPWSLCYKDANASIKTCVANNLLKYIEKSKSPILLTLYWPSYKGSFKILNILNDIAEEVREMNVELAKMDAKHNSIPLEYMSDTYPVHFFIPKKNREEATVRYINVDSSREQLLEFIRSNV